MIMMESYGIYESMKITIKINIILYEYDLVQAPSSIIAPLCFG